MENLIIIGRSRKDFFDLLNEWEESKTKQFNSTLEIKSDPVEDENFLTQKEVAKYLRISLPTLIRMKRDGRIPFYQSRKTILFKKSEILKSLRKDGN